MTVPMGHGPDNSSPVPSSLLSASDQGILLRSAVDPAMSAAQTRGCDIWFPGLGGHPDGMVRSCDACRLTGRPKYMGMGGHTPQPDILYDAGPGTTLMYVEGVLKSLCAAQAVPEAGLAYTVAFINGSDGINKKTRAAVALQAPGRDVVVILDSDIDSNPNVARSSVRIDGHLREAGAASVRFARVPRVDDSPTTGLDDYLASLPSASRGDALRSLEESAPPDMLVPSAFTEHAASLPGAADRSSFARHIAERVCSLDMPEAWTLDWKARLKSECRMAGKDFDAIRKDIDDRDRARSRQKAQEQVTRTGVEMPSPSEPLEVAHALLESENGAAVRDRVLIWRDDWYSWTETHWETRPATTLTDWLRRELRHAWYMSGGKEPGPVPWAPTTGKVSEVVDALASVLRRPDAEEPEQGVFTANGRVHMDGSITPHMPQTFNVSSLPYAYDPEATCPSWDAFTGSSLPEPEDRALLQEAAGYLLSGDTSHQKIIFLSGPPGSGKGTVLRVLEGLIGSDACTATSLSGLGSHFGMQSLIGKSAAFMADVRFNVSGAQDAVPNILQISGEDVVPVPRKNKENWKGRLPTRLVMASNDLPVLPDMAGALYRRLVVIKFGQSFVGREDTGLTGRLMQELPGILNWCLVGYRRLVERGRFPETAGGMELREAARRDANPVVAFVDDRCVLDPEAFTGSDEMFQAWEIYRLGQGYTRKDMSKPGLTRAVCGSFPGVDSGKVKKVNGRCVRGVTGLRILPESAL